MRATIQRQNSNAPPSNPAVYKPEFEGFFGFVEEQYPLIEQTYKSVNYRKGAFSISERAADVNAAAMTATIVNAIAMDTRLNLKIKFAILEHFVSPPKSSAGADSRLEEILSEIPVGTRCNFLFAVNKLSCAISLTDLPSTTEEIEESNSEYRFHMSILRENSGGQKGGYKWTFKLHGGIDVRSVDPTLYRQLETEFETSFRNTAAYTASALTALTQPRAAIYDNLDMSEAYVPVVLPKDAAVRRLLDSVVKSNILFKSYTVAEQSAIVDAFEQFDAENGDFVIRQKEMGDYFYVIEAGELEILLETNGVQVKVGRNLGPCDYFGELALMYNTPRAATVRAVDDCKLWRIDRKTYRRIVTHFHNLDMQQHVEFVKNVSILGRKLGDVLSLSEIQKVVSHLETEHFTDGTVIVRQGNAGDSFYIIKSGDVAVWQQQMHNNSPTWIQLATLHSSDYFGEKALLSEDVRMASCIAIGDVTCLSLNRDDFIAMLGSWTDLAQFRDKAPSQSIPSVNDRCAFLMDLNLEDLVQLRTLGQGAFGRVKLAQHKVTGQTFALKCQAKKAITKLKIENNVLNEMRLLRLIDHPRVGKLYSALQDNRFIYFVLELLQGGEFFTHLQKVGRLSEAKACFYAASVVSAFTALHSKKIAYRDLKPENMVMDAKGFVKIVDLGLAKQVMSGKTWTMCGTPDYLAPEIILNEGHDYSVDYWALGVLIYEMVTGWPPFYADEPMKTYEKIVACAVSYPVYITRHLSDLVSKLLQTQPGKRLGNLKGGIGDIMKHKWFGSFDWAGLEAMTIPVPFVPTIKDATDTSNFEKYAEEALPDISPWVADLN